MVIGFGRRWVVKIERKDGVVGGRVCLGRNSFDFGDKVIKRCRDRVGW